MLPHVQAVADELREMAEQSKSRALKLQLGEAADKLLNPPKPKNVLVRMPVELHAALKELARERGIPLNAICLEALGEKVRGDL